MKRIIAEISDELHHKLKQYSADNDISIKDIVIKLIEKLLKK